MRRRSRLDSSELGFTLIELVMVIAISAILAAVSGSFIRRPLEGYADVTRRATLVDVAESALRRTARDVRTALPNTVRVSGDQLKLEFLHIIDGGRYRDQTGTGHTDPNSWLQFNGDSVFNTLGRLNAATFTYGVPLAAGARVAVYTTDPVQTYSNAATSASPGVITPASTTVTILNNTDEDRVKLSASHEFEFESPLQRFYLLDTAVTYICDVGAGTLTRYWGYTINATQPTDPGVAPLSTAQSALLTNRVGACEFTYASGSTQRAALLMLDLTLTEASENVRELLQVHVSNTP